MNFRLFYHPESDSYYYGQPGDTDGLAEDVTGLPDHVAKAKERGVYAPREDLFATIEQRIRDALKPLAGEVNRRTCITCVHFKEEQVMCNLYKQMPPPRIVAFGCDEYMDERGVPF